MTPREAAELYLSLSWTPIVVPYKGKGPQTPGWQRRTLEEARAGVADFDRETNVGVLLGAPSGGLLDVDLDCPEALKLAPRFLPPTLTFGRPGSPHSHWLYQVDEDTKSMKFEDPIRKATPALGKACLCELRSSPLQTVFPGSIHESGETIAFDEEGPAVPTRIGAEELRRAVSHLAAACLLARNWPGGSRHEAQLALAGGLLGGGP